MCAQRQQQSPPQVHTLDAPNSVDTQPVSRFETCLEHRVFFLLLFLSLLTIFCRCHDLCTAAQPQLQPRTLPLDVSTRDHGHHLDASNGDNHHHHISFQLWRLSHILLKRAAPYLTPKPVTSILLHGMLSTNIQPDDFQPLSNSLST